MFEPFRISELDESNFQNLLVQILVLIFFSKFFSHL